MIIGINASNVKSVGGVNHIYNLILNLRKDEKKKHSIKKIIIWTSLQSYGALSELKDKDIIIERVKYDNIFFNFFWKIFLLNLNLNKNNCDILFSLDGIVLRKFKKTIILFQNLIPFNYQEIINYGLSFQLLKNIFTYYLYKISSYRADGFIVLSRYGLNLIKAKTIKLNNVEIIPHGVDSSFFNIISRKKKKNYINLIYISPIDHYKHQWNVIEAVIRLNKENHNIRLKLVGSISNKQSKNNLEKQMEKANVNKDIIKFYGNLNKKQIIELYKESDVFLFASSCESFGLTLLEGMASNLPVLCSNKSGMDVTTEKKAIYFNPWDFESIKASIEKYIYSSQDIKEQNSKVTTQIAKKYSWKITTDKTFSFIKKTCFKKTKIKFFNKFNFGLLEKIRNLYSNNYAINSYFFNFFSPMLIFYIIYFNGDQDLSVQYAIIISFSAFVTQLFSANLRNIIITDKPHKILYLIIQRITLSVIFIILGLLFFDNYFPDFNTIIVFLSFLMICTNWSKELVIAFSEINNKRNFNLIYQFLNVIALVLSISGALLNSNIHFIILLPIISFIELLHGVIIISIHEVKLKIFNNDKINYLSSKIVFEKKTFLNLALLSSFFLTLPNLLIRISVSEYFNTSVAADYIFCFSISTLPGTIITSIIGVSYLGKEKPYPNYFKLLLLFYFLSFIISFFISFSYLTINTNFAISIISITGIIMTFAHTARQLNIINPIKRNSVFMRDIIFSLISIILLLIFITYLKNYFILYILSTSIISFIVYMSYYNPLNNYKN